ncbi:MAG: lipase family protein [Anaerovibrio sp.]|uniref:lipase family protein n=1 Tax=Anaerovibrio sp. TaxID=1872532 RepID=UPI0025F710C9|nr:lipase family protein [Anaerovibrio sp.]MCR5175715.1 lipase family protein [Anaerovibrio sp.]
MKISKCAYKAFALMNKVVLTTALLIVMAISPASAASEVQTASIQFLCALGDILAYDSQLNGVIRTVSSHFGYDLTEYNNQNKKANANFFIFKSREPDKVLGRYVNIVAIPGTEKLKDVEVDLRLGKVLFGGASPEEFAELARTQDVKSNQPLVHRGFNDYTQTAFFTKKDDGSMGVDYIFDLAESDKDQVILTGHSLGGAVSVLLGCRLEAMGMDPNGIEVVTFGAPAVGNQVFADMYGKKLNHTRYTMSGDPVQYMLQMLKSGYVQTGNEVKCKRNANSHRFSHSMSEYLDYSIRNYLDALDKAGIQLKVIAPQTDNTDQFSLRKEMFADRVYMCPAVIDLPDDIINDKDYMMQLSDIMSCYGFKEAVDGVEEKYADQMREARKQQCGRISHVTIDAKLLKKHVYQVTVNEELTDAYGNVVSTQTCGTTTDNISPLEAVFFGLSRCSMNRKAADELKTE